MIRYLAGTVYFAAIVVLLLSCAQPGSLGGGPKDTEPAKVLKSVPENFSPNFTGDKFTIYFDEYIELDNIMQKALLSPPTDKMPDFKVKGKTLQVRFKEPLKENTTYSVYFGDAIVDITEKNPLLNFTYVFSTGDLVDSLSIHGTVINSFDLKPVESIYVMLYKDNNDTISLDSLPLNVKPYYLSKTDVNGNFIFNGLANEKYLMFAIKDMNSNYFYDQPVEEIAYYDSLVTPFYVNLKVFDSIASDTAAASDLKTPKKVVNKDSMALASLNLPNYQLLMFAERDSSQKLLQVTVIRENTVRFAFNLPADSIQITPLNYSSDSNWYIEEFSKEHDTITWYLKNIPVDSLEMMLYNKSDSLEKVYLSLEAGKKSQKNVRQKKEVDKEVKKYVGYSTNIKSNNLKLDLIPEINFFSPIVSWNTDSVLLVEGNDSIYNPEFHFTDKYNIYLQYPIVLKEDTKYSISIPDSTFIDWNGLHNEAINLNFKTKAKKDYGTFRLKVVPEKKQQYVIRLQTEKDVAVREYVIHSDTTLEMDYLYPGKYTLKLFFDNNANKKWDAGKYVYKIQPEKVLFYTKPIEIRANWDVEEEWKFE